MTRKVELKLVQGNLVAVTLAPVMNGEYFVSAYDGEEFISHVNGWPRYTNGNDKWQRVVGTNHPMHNLPRISQATVLKWYEGYRFFELRFTTMDDREYPLCDHEGELCTAVIKNDNVGSTETEPWETRGLTDDSLGTYEGNLMFYSTAQVKELIKRAAFEDNTIILLDGIEEWFKNNLK